MPCFVCEKCGCIENTACGDYWCNYALGQPVLCSLCSPIIGKWHGHFKRKKYSGEQDILNPEVGNKFLDKADS